MSIHADDEFSLRIALESELDGVLPSEGLAGVVIARHRKIRRRRVAGAVSLVVVCAGIGVPLGLSGPGGKPPQHNPGQRPDQHTGSVTLIPPARTGAVLVIERPAPVLVWPPAAAGLVWPPAAAGLVWPPSAAGFTAAAA